MFLFPKPCVILVLNVIGSVVWLIELTDISGGTVFQHLCAALQQKGLEQPSFSLFPLKSKRVGPELSTPLGLSVVSDALLS